MSDMRISSLIAPVYFDAHRDIRNGAHDAYWINGGRGSGKSAFMSIEIITGILRDPNANALILRRVGNTIKDSVFAQMIWATDMMGISDKFHAKVSPYELIYKPTGQRILFRGTDDPMKLKSIKLTKGYFKYLWCEELAEFRSMDDVRNIAQSVFRGIDNGFTFYSYNPPKSAQSWVNKEALKHNERRFTLTTSYLDVPRAWLGDKFIADAETLKMTNETAYRNEYLGEVTGNGGNVFENVRVRDIPNDEIDRLEWFYQGVDWGYFPDPFAWVRCAYDAQRRTLHIIDEYVVNKASNADTYDALKDKLRMDDSLYADSAEPKSIADWKQYGAYNIHGVNKASVGGKGSVTYSMKWLSSLSEIVIDARRTPNTAREFTAYEYERNAAGEFVGGYVDAENHCIDAVRYALSPIWRRAGE